MKKSLNILFKNQQKTPYLFLLPFIIVPFLTSFTFHDPTLLIKRSATFFLFFLIGLFFLKTKPYSLSLHSIKLIYSKIIFITILFIVSYFNSTNPIESFWGALYLLGWVAIYSFFSLYSNSQTIKYIIYISAVIGSIISLIALNSYFELIPLSLPGNQMFRGTFGNRNFLCQYLCFTVTASFIATLITQNNFHKNIFLISFLINISTMIMIRQRAAWLGIFIALFLCIILHRKLILDQLRQLISYKKIILMGSILIPLFLSFNFYKVDPIKIEGSFKSAGNKGTILKTIKSTFTATTDSLSIGRFNTYNSSLEIIKNNILFGIGFKNWRLIHPRYSNNESTHNTIKDSDFGQIKQRPHNDFLWLLSELGLFMTILIIYYIAHHMRLIYKKIKSDKNSTEQLIHTFCLISIIAIIIESMFDFPIERTMPNLYFWSILGYISSTSNNIIIYKKYKFSILLQPIMFVVCLFSFYDLKANLYAQKASYYSYNNQPEKSLINSNLTLSYYRNLDSAGTPINYYLGISEYARGNKKNAMSHFNDALKLSPYHIGSLMNYMILLGENNELQKAHSIMLIIKKIYSKMAKPRLDMAKFYIRAGEKIQAKEILIDLKNHNLNDSFNTREKLLQLINQ